MDDARTRDETADRYRWDPTVLFSDDDEWEAAFERYGERVEALSFERAIADDPDALARTLRARDELIALGSRLKIYAECRAWADVSDEAAQARVRRVERLDAERDAAFAGLEDALRDAGRERLDALVEGHPDLREYGHYVDDVLRRGAHTLDPATEAVVGELEESLDAPSRTLRIIDDRAFDPPTVRGPDGDEIRLTRVARFDALTYPDRAFRRRVYEAYREALRENREVTAQAYVDHLRSHAALADVRNHESPLAASMDGVVPPDAARSLVDSLRDYGGSFQRRYERLRERLGVEELRPWDLRAPLTDSDGPEIPYDEATDLMVEAVAPLGEAYQEDLAAFLDQRRVDVYPAENKRGVQAAMLGENGTPAFVHMNYGADLESLFLFAHELAHVMHYRLAKQAQPPAYRRLSWHVGEVPSFVNEVLLARHLLDGDCVADDAVLDVALGRLPPLAAARGAAFTHRIVDDVRADEEPTADDVDRHFRETGEAFFDHVAFDEDDGDRWLSLNLDRDPFHAYYYVIGRTCALAVAGRLREGDVAPGAYREFLRAGDSQYPMDLLETLGIDLGSGAVVEAAAGEYGRLADSL